MKNCALDSLKWETMSPRTHKPKIVNKSLISTKVWDRAGMELTTPGSAVRHASVARNVTNCALRPGPTEYLFVEKLKKKIWLTGVLR